MIMLKDFLENSPLYEKYKFLYPIKNNIIEYPNIDMECNQCKEKRSFLLIQSTHGSDLGVSYYYKNSGSIRTLNDNDLIYLYYKCVSCNSLTRIFIIRYIIYIVKEPYSETGYIQKIGQYPAISRKIPKKIQKALGQLENLYQKGLNIEGHGFGVGAFAYYRQIIEKKINDIGDMIKDIIDGEILTKFNAKWDILKNKKEMEPKIEFLKDYLPKHLNPSGYNPLKELYSALSIGLHNQTDDECLKKAVIIRTILDYLLVQLVQEKIEKEKFLDSLKELKRNS